MVDVGGVCINAFQHQITSNLIYEIVMFCSFLFLFFKSNLNNLRLLNIQNETKKEEIIIRLPRFDLNDMAIEECDGEGKMNNCETNAIKQNKIKSTTPVNWFWVCMCVCVRVCLTERYKRCIVK